MGNGIQKTDDVANGKVVDEDNKSTKDGEKEEKKEEQKMVGPIEIVSSKIKLYSKYSN